MQVSRLFQIVYILLNKKRVTAKELAQKFNVSQRTIYRDIDILSLSGVPVYTSKGRGGGIHILDEFVLDKSILSEAEQEEILSALQGYNVIQQDDLSETLNKLSSLFNRSSTSWIEVDCSDWSFYRGDAFHQLKTAILGQYVVEFKYYNSRGEAAQRQVEPIMLWFKHKAWYMRGFCLEKNDIRLFKLTRMHDVSILGEHFRKRNLLNYYNGEEVQEESYPLNVEFEFKISQRFAYRVYDEFGENQIEKNDDGSFTVKTAWQENEWVYGFILSFGEDIEVVKPLYVRDIILKKVQGIQAKYLLPHK